MGDLPALSWYLYDGKKGSSPSAALLNYTASSHSTKFNVNTAARVAELSTQLQYCRTSKVAVGTELNL